MVRTTSYFPLTMPAKSYSSFRALCAAHGEVRLDHLGDQQAREAAVIRQPRCFLQGRGQR